MVKLIHTDPSTKKKHVRIRLEIFTVLVVAVLAVVIFLSFSSLTTGSSLGLAQNNLATETGKVSALNSTISNLNSSLQNDNVKISSFVTNVSTQANTIANLNAEIQALETNASNILIKLKAADAGNFNYQFLISSLESNISGLNSNISKLNSVNSVLSVNNYKILQYYIPTGSISLDNLLPTSFNITAFTPSPWTEYAMINSVSWNGSTMFMVGGKSSANFSGSPPISTAAVYNVALNKMTDLTSKLSAYNGYYLMAVASNGASDLIFGAYPANTSSGYHTALLQYSNGVFTNLTSTLPAGADFTPQDAVYQNGVYLITGYYSPKGSTSVSPRLFSYSTTAGLKNISIPAAFDGSVFLSLAYDGSQYGILDANFSGSNVCALTYSCSWSTLTPSPLNTNMVMYNPSANTFTSYNISISNWFNGGLAWDGANFFIASAIPSGFTTGLFNPSTNKYLPIRPPVHEIGGVPGQGLAWNGYEFFVPGLGPGGNGVSPFLYIFNNQPFA